MLIDIEKQKQQSFKKEKFHIVRKSLLVCYKFFL